MSFRICREHAAREGWQIAGEYESPATTDASKILRPGIQTLLEDAKRSLFGSLVAQPLDRVNRDQVDMATLYKHQHIAGMTVEALAEGEVSEMHLGL